MLRDYDAELKQVAETNGRKWLESRGMAMLESALRHTDSPLFINEVMEIVAAVQKYREDESLPYNIENDPFAEGQTENKNNLISSILPYERKLVKMISVTKCCYADLGVKEYRSEYEVGYETCCGECGNVDYDIIEISECCGEEVINGLCSECKEHC